MLKWDVAKLIAIETSMCCIEEENAGQLKDVDVVEKLPRL